MVQRIQTLYLLVAAVLLVAVNFFPLITVQEDMMTYVVRATGVEGFQGTAAWCWGIVGSSAVGAFLALVALLSYTNRRRQMSLCVYAIVAVVTYHVFLAVQVWTILSACSEAAPSLGFYAQLPLVSVIFLILAGRAIKRDEALVRSMDRIR